MEFQEAATDWNHGNYTDHNAGGRRFSIFRVANDECRATTTVAALLEFANATV